MSEKVGAIITIFGAVLAVWLRAEIAIAVLRERVRSQGLALEEHKDHHKEFSTEIKVMLNKIFDKMSDIEKELGQKVNVNKNGQ